MKKYVFLLTSVFLLGACTSAENSSDVDVMQATIDSLRAENEALKSGTDESVDAPNDDVELDETDSDEDIEMYNLNDEVSFGDGSKETMQLKLTEVTSAQEAFPDYMISMDDYDTSKMIAITIEYTNVDMDDPYIPSTYDFQAYDKDGNALGETMQQSGQDRVAKGRSGKTQIYFETSENAAELNEIEIDFVPDDRLATFDVEVSH